MSSLSKSGEWSIIKNSDKIDPSLQQVGRLSHNYLKNRWGDIIALDETRVKLDGRDSPDNYINANYVDVGNGELFIACQAPTISTLDDFWWMVWNNRVSIICMFTRVIEKNKPKADVYWPTRRGDTIFFLDGKLRISNIETQEVRRFRITSLHIKYNEESRDIRHFQYIAWPDMGVPELPDDIEYFIRILPTFRRNPNDKVVIHCSAGCGRTGVVCAVYRKLKTNENILDIVKSLRKYRSEMVQTKEQYKFIYTIVNLADGHS